MHVTITRVSGVLASTVTANKDTSVSGKIDLRKAQKVAAPAEAPQRHLRVVR